MNIKWQIIKQFEDIRYEKGMFDAQNINKITINRPEVRNSFRPQTVFELKDINLKILRYDHPPA